MKRKSPESNSSRWTCNSPSGSNSNPITNRYRGGSSTQEPLLLFLGRTFWFRHHQGAMVCLRRVLGCGRNPCGFLLFFCLRDLQSPSPESRFSTVDATMNGQAYVADTRRIEVLRLPGAGAGYFGSAPTAKSKSAPIASGEKTLSAIGAK